MSMGQTESRYEGLEGFVGMLSPSLDSNIHYGWNFGFVNKKYEPQISYKSLRNCQKIFEPHSHRYNKYK